VEEEEEKKGGVKERRKIRKKGKGQRRGGKEKKRRLSPTPNLHFLLRHWPQLIWMTDYGPASHLSLAISLGVAVGPGNATVWGSEERCITCMPQLSSWPKITSISARDYGLGVSVNRVSVVQVVTWDAAKMRTDASRPLGPATGNGRMLLSPCLRHH